MLVVESRGEYERELASIKATARLTIRGYKVGERPRTSPRNLCHNLQEQLECKERALGEYKQIISAMQTAAANDAGRPLIAAPPTAAAQIIELLADDAANEALERQIIALQLQLAEAEEANARLADRLQVAQHAPPPPPPPDVAPQASIGVQTAAIREPLDRQPSDDDRSTAPSADSGTVQDLSSDGESHNEAAANAADTRPLRQRSRSGSTRTLDEASAAASVAEAQLFRQRGDVRRLRERLAALERRNRVCAAASQSSACVARVYRS